MEDKILNPTTGRYVKKDGKIGQLILDSLFTGKSKVNTIFGIEYLEKWVDPETGKTIYFMGEPVEEKLRPCLKQGVDLDKLLEREMRDSDEEFQVFESIDLDEILDPENQNIVVVTKSDRIFTDFLKDLKFVKVYKKENYGMNCLNVSDLRLPLF